MIFKAICDREGGQARPAYHRQLIILSALVYLAESQGQSHQQIL
jgi:hypothetical protein